MAFFKNNRNNGDTQTAAPSMPYSPGQFIVPTGTGVFIPYQLATTVTTGAFTGTFVVGEAVSQATSSAAGVILAIGSQKLVIGSVTGTFDNTHVVTGGTSGATATASAVSILKNIMGICNDKMQSTDSDYATAGKKVTLSTPVKVMDYLTIPVSSGTATALLEGTYVDVDPANPDSVIVSAAGTQIFVTKFINASLIEGIISLNV